MRQLAAFTLLAVALLVVAAAASVMLVSSNRLFRLVARRHRSELVMRRCDRCGRAWRAEPRREYSVTGLRARRWLRRRLRAAGRETVPGWTRPRGWSRCPSCLSRRVRATGEPVTAQVWTRMEGAGLVACMLGLALMALAVAALLL